MADNLGFSLEAMGVKLPYNMQAEQAVLGAVIIDPSNVALMVERLRPEQFYARQNGEIFAEIVQLFMTSTPIDFLILFSKVTDAKIFDSENEAKEYLTILAETVPSVSNLDYYMGIVEEKFLIRRLMNVAKDILDETTESADSKMSLELAEQKIYEIRAGREQSGMQPINSAIIDALTQLQKISGPDRDKYLGIKSGFAHLDRVLTGLGKGDFIILAARPGMGKTSFALNIAANVAKTKTPVAVFSLEMTVEQLVTRMLSSEAAVDSQALRSGVLTGNDWDSLAMAGERMSNSTMLLDDSSNITVTEIKAKVKRYNQNPETPNIGLIIIDYLQLMNSGNKTSSRVQEISEITRNLKIMAKELEVPIITLSQLSRSTERGSTTHRPTLSDLRDSGSIEQDADVVMFLLREAYYSDGEEETDSSKAVCIVAKNRHGEVADVQLGWDGEHTKFISVDYVSEEY